MNKQYSFKERENQCRDLTVQRNWTDQRVFQIMKKYEKPSRNANPTTCQPILSYDKTSNYSPLLQEEKWKKDQTPLGQRNYNVDRSYIDQDFSTKKKWNQNDKLPQRGNQNSYGIVSKSIDLATPQRLSENYLFREENLTVETQYKNNLNLTPESKWQKYSRTPTQDYCRDYPHTSNIVGDRSEYDDLKHSSKYTYAQRKRQQHSSPFNAQTNTLQDEGCLRSSKLRYDKTPVKKYTNRVATQYCQKESREMSFKKDNRSSHSNNKYQSIDCDTRISNIDKINDKIKKILQKCQAQQDSEIRLEKKYKLDLTPQKYHFEMSHKKKGTEVYPSSILVNNSSKKGQTYERELTKEKNTRSRSYLKEKAKTPQRYDEDDEKFTKIQDKLNKYNDRVTLLAEEKKKLNIDFKLNKPESSFLRKQDPVSSNVSQNSKPKNKLPEVDIVESHRDNPNNDSQIIKEREEEHIQKTGNFKMNSKCSSYLRNTQNEEYQCTMRTDAIDKEQSLRDFDYFPTNQESKSYASIGNAETKRLVKVLSAQVKLDQQFRLTKNWFVNSQISGEYEVLQSILEQRWRQMPISEIQTEFSVNFEEDDPFYSYRPDHFVLEDLVNNYIICNKNWKEKVESQFDMEQLQQEGLIERLDMDNKDTIAIEDLVRIINMQEGTFYRNRDLYLIYQRLIKHSSSDELSITTFKEILRNK